MECKNGKHHLIVIYSSLYDCIGEVYAVIRWCKNCGAVVVDTEVDNRISPGKIMEMRFPEITKGKNNG